MRSSSKWLRISYWGGAVADGVVAAMMLDQAAFGRPSPLADYLPEVPFRYAIGLAGSLMLGWTLLLLWADRKPVERRGVLVMTIVVVLGLMASTSVAAMVGFMEPAPAGAVIAFQVVLIILFACSYLASVKQSG